MNQGFTGMGRIAATVYEADEMKGFSRTIAQIEWLLVILVLLYQVVQGHNDETTAPIYWGLAAYSAFVVSLRHINIYRNESRWKFAVETCAIIVFITWILYHSGRLESPLVNLYLLTVVISALTLGKLITLLEVALIGACYVFLAYTAPVDSASSIPSAGNFMIQLAPMLLVAYITTMLSAETRSALLRIKEISKTDDLTGIYNIRAFTALANHTHKQSVRYRQSYSIVMVDLDSMKIINDNYGHEAGNRLLKLTVTCIQQELRETDVFARYGGDEFVLLLPQTGMDGAFKAAERVRKTIESTPLSTHGEQVSTTVSTGIATFPEHGKNFAALMNCADQALYSSKKDGRNRTSVSGAAQEST